MRKILNVIFGLNIGGAETFIYNVLKTLPDTEYQIDFAIQNPVITNDRIKNQINNRNARVFIIPSFYKRPIKNALLIKKLSKEYDVIHYHFNSLINFLPPTLSKKLDSKIIIHSHNSNNNYGGAIGKIIHYLGRYMISSDRYTKIACSNMAAKWMFNESAIIIPNGINPVEFRYSKEDQTDIRHQLPKEIKEIIGHIGRFVNAKNHIFLIEIFKQYTIKHPDTALVLVGDGELKSSIEQLVTNEKINNVYFMGEQQNVNNYYQSFDCFLFPSKYEGLPFVLVEAQAAGCPVVTSTNVTTEIDVTGGVKFLELSDDISFWVKTIEESIKNSDRRSIQQKFDYSKYNIQNSLKQIKSLYQS